VPRLIEIKPYPELAVIPAERCDAARGKGIQVDRSKQISTPGSLLSREAKLRARRDDRPASAHIHGGQVQIQHRFLLLEIRFIEFSHANDLAHDLGVEAGALASE